MTTATARLDLTPKTCQLQTTGIGMKCVFSATCVENHCAQTGSSHSTRIRSCVMTATSLTSRRRVKDAAMRSNQGARVSNTMERTGTRNASNVPSAKRPLGPVVSSQKTTSSTVLTVIKIYTPSAAPSAANRCLKAASCTTNKRGTKSALAVTAATSP